MISQSKTWKVDGMANKAASTKNPEFNANWTDRGKRDDEPVTGSRRSDELPSSIAVFAPS